MSLATVREMTKDLPRGLSTQVVSYAESVERVLPEIFRGADREFNRTVGDQLVFLAGVRKLHSIVASNYWTLDNSAALLQNLNINGIQSGQMDFSRGSVFHQKLRRLLEALEGVVGEHHLTQYLNARFSEVIQMLVADGH